ncbi:DUF2796 domain-containing protein [Oceanimonas sp. CHS3-5]|uniref:DUF2796 domain-containing protein n=1 Tax=Oceanimonas sp. CHS3-5 TaxID=3068186 RepID=UPI00273F7787|nr:DUF2796 domain-containing protein [Oceanimonas sp. CHS3-5]MDP5291272.1 DUF2796 domain-containing protein [Oceanimonas sp. CHS3-5]
MNIKPLALAVSLLPAALSANIQLGVHEHGFGQLNLAQDGQGLMLELISPAADIVGFEHNPATSEERAAFAQAINTGLDAAALFTLPAAAGCELEQAAHIEQNNHHGHDEHDHDEHHDHDERHDHDEHEHHEDEHEHHKEHAHQDIQLHYAWQCAQPDALNSLNAAGLFQVFPSFNRIELQGILASGQMAATLTPEQPQANW